MHLIKVLDDNLIDKIAAGEVVERPGSVVKELVENSIDAGATAVTIEIKDGGISLVRVTDNGRGMAPEDALSAFTRHATSKISSLNDLENILTLGFRGEALSSIASVSQVEMVTKPADALMAKRIEIHGGKLISQQEVGAADGTTFIMRNLFYNTPARRKFLKKPGTESGYINDIVQKLALGHPEVSFRYIVNNSEILYTNGNGELKSAVLSVYGRDVAKNLIAVDTGKEGFGINGYICRPEMNRGNRNYGNFFINGRYVKSELIQSAIEEGYGTKLMGGKFPIYVLNLAIDPKLVDVNVHPTKLEVRFSDEQAIFDFCLKAIDKALGNEILIPRTAPGGKPKVGPDSAVLAADRDNLSTQEKSLFATNAYQIDKDNPLSLETSPASRRGGDMPGGRAPGKRYAVDINELISAHSLFPDTGQGSGAPFYTGGVSEERKPYGNDCNKNTGQVASDGEEKPQGFFTNYRIIGQVFMTYWIVEQNASIYLIDQHAAHERVLYENFVESYKASDLSTQRLLSPQVMKLSPLEQETVKENMPLLQSFGFELEAMEEGVYVLKGVPFLFKGPVSTALFTEIMDQLQEAGKHPENIFDTKHKLNAIATISCKAAVKGNDKLSYPEAKALIERMLQLKDPFTCPHGRPTIIELSKYEIEKMFKRIV